MRDTTPRCRSWTSFDVSVLHWISGSRHRYYSPDLMLIIDPNTGKEAVVLSPDFAGGPAISVGRIRNWNSRLATGFGVSVGFQTPEARSESILRLEGRSRIWIGDRSSI